jgi:hypothetical protein
MMSQVGYKNIWKFTAYADADHHRRGIPLWEKTITNLVPTAGLNDSLTKYFKGSAYTATWFVGLIDNANFSALAATDTAAKITTSAPSGGTNAWRESVAYTETVRQTLTLGTAAAGIMSNSASLATFTINAPTVLKGGFLVSTSTKGGTTGVLFGEAGFALGVQTLVSGNILTIQVDITATSV